MATRENKKWSWVTDGTGDDSTEQQTRPGRRVVLVWQSMDPASNNAILYPSDNSSVINNLWFYSTTFASVYSTSFFKTCPQWLCSHECLMSQELLPGSIISVYVTNHTSYSGNLHALELCGGVFIIMRLMLCMLIGTYLTTSLLHHLDLVVTKCYRDNVPLHYYRGVPSKQPWLLGPGYWL